MNIYTQEIKSLLKNTIIWAVSLGLLVMMFIMIYPALAKDAEQFTSMLANYPPEVIKAFGATIDLVTSLNGFYSYCLFYLNLCVAIQGMLFGVSVLSKESARKTCDFIFVKPVTRSKVLFSKLGAILTCLVFTDVVVIVTAIVGAFSVKTENFDLDVFLLISATMVFTQVIFASLGFFCAALTRKIKSPAALSLGVVISFFGLAMIQNVLMDEKLKYLSFLTYFKGEYIIKNGHYEAGMLICAVIAVFCFLTIAFVYYGKKDIHAA